MEQEGVGWWRKRRLKINEEVETVIGRKKMEQPERQDEEELTYLGGRVKKKTKKKSKGKECGIKLIL